MTEYPIARAYADARITTHLRRHDRDHEGDHRPLAGRVTARPASDPTRGRTTPRRSGGSSRSQSLAALRRAGRRRRPTDARAGGCRASTCADRTAELCWPSTRRGRSSSGAGSTQRADDHLRGAGRSSSRSSRTSRSTPTARRCTRPTSCTPASTRATGRRSTPGPTPGRSARADRSADAVPRRSTTRPSRTALDAVVAGRRVVGVMGGHALTQGRRRVPRRRPAGPGRRPHRRARRHRRRSRRDGGRQPRGHAWPDTPTRRSTRPCRCSPRVPALPTRRSPPGRTWRSRCVTRWPRRRRAGRPDLVLRPRAAERVRLGDRQVLPERGARGDARCGAATAGSCSCPAPPARSRRCSRTPARTTTPTSRRWRRWCSSGSTTGPVWCRHGPCSAPSARPTDGADGCARGRRRRGRRGPLGVKGRLVLRLPAGVRCRGSRTVVPTRG